MPCLHPALCSNNILFPSFVLVLSTLTCGPAMCPTAAVWEGKGTGLGRVAGAEVAGKVLGPWSVA